jgi:hypothetical protein
MHFFIYNRSTGLRPLSKAPREFPWLVFNRESALAGLRSDVSRPKD